MAKRTLHRFTAHEKDLIQKAHLKLGDECFEFLRVTFKFGIRSTKEHYKHYIAANQADFTAEEDEQLVLYAREGIAFGQMAKNFENRTWVQLRNRYKMIKRIESRTEAQTSIQEATVHRIEALIQETLPFADSQTETQTQTQTETETERPNFILDDGNPFDPDEEFSTFFV
jgi:hypothetical protein